MITILSIWTVVALVLFIAIGLWAWSDRNKADFESAAQIPFEEDNDVIVSREGSENG